MWWILKHMSTDICFKKSIILDLEFPQEAHEPSPFGKPEKLSVHCHWDAEQSHADDTLDDSQKKKKSYHWEVQSGDVLTCVARIVLFPIFHF